MSEMLIQTVRYHHCPEKANSHGEIVASVSPPPSAKSGVQLVYYGNEQ